MYFRIDLDGKDGEHLAIFAETNGQSLDIFQQFCIALDGKIEDLEHCRLSTIFDVGGQPIKTVDPKLGWRRIGGDEWDTATEIKRTIYLRDQQVARNAKPPCALCAGAGRLASSGKVCPSCMGTGKLP